jgi:small subunit ribosomal protein S4
VSEYGLRLIEKQKLCRNYGVTERQLRRLMIEARAADGPTGDRLIELLERRLDNVVYRAGFARTIPGARQLVNHGHITVDGRKVDRSSYLVVPHQTVALRERSRDLAPVLAAVQAPKTMETSWLEVNATERSVRMSVAPDAASVPFPISVQLVVEFYSQRL